MAITNTGAVERNITGVNESEAFRQDSRTNLLTYSEDFSQWSVNEITTQTGFLAPDGSNNAYKITKDGGSGILYLTSVLTSTATRTIYARTVSGTGQLNLTSHNANTNNLFTLTENWQRFEVNGTTSASGQASFYALDFRGSSTLSEVIIWGAQAEEGSEATEYIPTNGAPVTIDNNSTSTVTNTGVVEREIEASHDANFVHPLGDELVTNGDFATDSDWTSLNSTISIENSEITVDSLSGGTGAYQNIQTEIGASYVIEAHSSSHVVGALVRVSNSAVPTAGFLSGDVVDGVSYFVFTALGTNTNIYLRNTTLGTSIWQSVSVKEVLVNRESTVTNTGAVEREIEASHDANFVHPLGDELVTNGDFATDSDWVKGTGWSISNGKAIATNASNQSLSQSTSSVLLNKKYIISFDVEYISGSAKFQFLGGTTQNVATIESSGTQIIEFVSDADKPSYRVKGLTTDGGFNGSIDNVSIKEVLVNRESTVTNTGAVEREVEASHDANFVRPLGDELISNGGFDTESDWTLSGETSISNGKLSFENTSSFSDARQSNIASSGSIYKLSFIVSDYSGGSIQLPFFGAEDGNGGYVINSNGSYSLEDTLFSSDFRIKRRVNGTNLKVDNISLKEVLVNRESTVTNTGVTIRDIEGINESDTF